MPSIVDGLFSGRAGIQSHGTAISVLADNISNQNTTGFKASRADFVDLLAGTIGGSTNSSTGSGSSVNAITQLQNQGTFESTGRGLDVAIDGNGFFIAENDLGTRYYTRAGNLQVDPEGNLLDQNGLLVLGFPANGAGGLQALNVNQRVQGDIETNEITLGGNLNAARGTNANAPANLAAAQAITSFQTLSDEADFQYTVKVFDSLGASHDVNFYFYKTSSTTWAAHAYVDGGDTTAGFGNAGQAEHIGVVDLTFTNSGALNFTGFPTTGTATLAMTGLTSGAADMSIDVDFTLFSHFASANNISSANQDGTGSGSVTGFSINADGTLFAQLDNGQTSTIGVLALATFANSEGLNRVGNSLYTESINSGEAVIGSPGVGIFGDLQAGSLELSTADLAADFIKLISLQRGFQGSSRVVSSINDLLTEIVNLAR